MNNFKVTSVIILISLIIILSNSNAISQNRSENNVVYTCVGFLTDFLEDDKFSLGLFVSIKIDTELTYAWIKRKGFKEGRPFPVYPSSQLNKGDSLITDDIYAEFEISGAFNETCLIGILKKYGRMILNSNKRLNLIKGNFQLTESGKLILKMPSVEAGIKCTIHVHVDSNSIGMLISDGAVVLNNKKHLRIARQGEFAIVKKDGSILIEKAYGDIATNLTKLKNWQSVMLPRISKQKRLNRLMLSSRFANINTGSGNLDFHEPTFDFGSNILVGHLKLIIHP